MKYACLSHKSRKRSEIRKKRRESVNTFNGNISNVLRECYPDFSKVFVKSERKRRKILKRMMKKMADRARWRDVRLKTIKLIYGPHGFRAG